MSGSDEKFVFIVYHTHISPEGVAAIGDIYPEKPETQWKGRWEFFEKNYLPEVDQYIKMFFESAQLCHPNCRCVLLTDLKTPFSLPKEIELHRCDIDPNKPAYGRLKAQKQFLSQSEDTRHHVFLDYDMLVQRSLKDILTTQFDIALTHERIFDRINGSFIFVRKGSKQRGILFFEAVETIYLSTYTLYEAWGGVEVSMTDLVHRDNKVIHPTKVIEIDQSKVLVLPSDQYNYPLSDHEMTFLEFLPQKTILHFRGMRKETMKEYYNTFIRPA